MNYFGVPKIAGVGIAAVLVMIGVAQGNFRRFERFALLLSFGSLPIWTAFTRANDGSRASGYTTDRDTWRMPPLETLPKMVLTPMNRLWLIVLRGYLIVAVALVIFRIAQIALQHGSA